MDEKNPEISPVPEAEPEPVAAAPEAAVPNAAAPEAAPTVAPEPEVTAPVAEPAAVTEPEPTAAAAPVTAEAEAAPAAPAPAQPAAPDVSNPFAAHRPAAPGPAPEAVAAASAPAPEPTAPYAVGIPAQSAAQPYAQPYGQAVPTPAVAAPAPGYSAYERAYGAAAGQPSHGAAAPQPYGAVPQQPYGAVPPTPPVPPAPVYGYEPPASGGQKRRWPWFLLGLAVGLVIGLGGCVSCAGIMAATAYDSTNDYVPGLDPDYGYNYGYGDRNDRNDRNNGDSGSVPTLPDAPDTPSTVGTYTADEIAKTLFPDGVPTDAPADGVCKAGVYEVGAAGQIPAGLYFLQGAEDAESNYYIFEAADNLPGRYTVDDSVVYFGNYFAELDEGDLIVFKPAADQTMYPAPSESFNPTAPYNDGCYRVGIDIPAGTYTITTYAPSAEVTTKECGAYVMKDLDFDDDSITESVYVIAGGTQTITVSDGQYLELFATTATPAGGAPAEPALQN